MVYRVFVEKKDGLRNEAESLLREFNSMLGIRSLTGVRLFNRYDAEDLTPEEFERAVRTVFSEPQLDDAYPELPVKEGRVLSVEYLPGQFDQRADSAARCIQFLTGNVPLIRTARVYVLTGALTEEEYGSIRRYLINPVEAREASPEKPETLRMAFSVPEPVPVLEGFTALSREGLCGFVREYGLAMDADDAAFCQAYFRDAGRNPTLTEIRMIDTYWSDHCRHTTFLTTVDSVRFEDPLLEKTYEDYLRVRRELGRTKPVNLMDVGTIAAKYLKKQGLLDKLDESEEINACTVRVDVTLDGKKEPWLLLFKNETHNHPTEIEPFGGAATCIGGAIRDPLSGRSYVYAAMRVTGAADPTVPVSETMEGKLPQRKIVQTAAAGYSSYGNQIGLATGIVSELYHPGYAAKRMEIGAVIGAAPAENVRRETPAPGDAVILLGGRTGRDGIGGATGSSKAHNLHSVETCGAEVQKGNAPEERKLQRLFRRGDACRMIKRCNDFGAGGVSVAIGELADGLRINLDAVPKKYEGLDGTELAISESQERMAVVVAPEDAERFCAIAKEENLEATVVAAVTAEPRLTMTFMGQTVVDVSREFLNSNGAEKHIDVIAEAPRLYQREIPADFAEGYRALVQDLNVCSQKGLGERFDSTIGAGTVLMPFGGKYQRTPVQSMVHLISSEKKHTEDCSFMSWGYNPMVAEQSPYHGAYLAVVESLSKLIATGASAEDTYLTFQEYFEKPLRDGRRWGKPLSALLGAFRAQLDFGAAAIGGKDSMSGSFENLDVPPTLVSFAVTTGKAGDVVSPELKQAGHKVILVAPLYREDDLPDAVSCRQCFTKVTELMREGRVYAACTPTFGGIAEAIYKMAVGNGFGFSFAPGITKADLFSLKYGSFLLEVSEDTAGQTLGTVTGDGMLRLGGESVSMAELDALYEGRLESVYPTKVSGQPSETPEGLKCKTAATGSAAAKAAGSRRKTGVRPTVLIPVFPGTNCEYDSARAAEDAGFAARTFIINNLDREGILRSIEGFSRELRSAQLLFLPGGFSGGDEPDGSAKFITAFFRNEQVKAETEALLYDRDGLMLGICNGFQALIKLGLVPFGHIIDTDETCPTLTFNRIGRHQSGLVRTGIVSNASPWLKRTRPGEVYTVPVSHGEGRFMASDRTLAELAEKGQIATQYVDFEGVPSMDIRFNPNGSAMAIEGITSPDGRILGKMGHTERCRNGLYRNVPGVYDMQLFASALDYLKEL